MVVKIMLPLWVRTIIRHLIFRVPKKGPLTTTHIVKADNLSPKTMNLRVPVPLSSLSRLIKRIDKGVSGNREP